MAKKNILIILADQLRKDSLGCYGNKVVTTTNIDKLAAQGVKYQRAYVANPICSPNRLSIFTGMNIRNHGLWTNGLLLENERKTLPGELVEFGYQTASFGKIHFEPNCEGSRESFSFWKDKGDDIQPYGPYWGFQHVEFTLGHSGDPIAHYGKWFRENGGTADMFEKDHQGCTGVPPSIHTSAFVGERVSRFIKEERDMEKPFFICASFPDPHHPFDPPREMREKYTLEDAILPTGSKEDLDLRPEHYKEHFRGEWHRKGKIESLEPDGPSLDEERRRIVNTYAMVDLIDENIGKILLTLEEERLMEETLIVFTSDHGELLGDHGLWYKGPFYYEGLINVPMIVCAKGDINPCVSEALMSSIDIAPTIFDYLKLDRPIYMDGISQLPHLMDNDIEVRSHCLIEYRNGYGEQDVVSKALVTKETKYVRFEHGSEELTDLKLDPIESTNVVNSEAYSDKLFEVRNKFVNVLLSTERKYPEQRSHA